jgi:hypothetical protein
LPTRPVPVDAIGQLTLVDPQNRPIAVVARGPAVEIGFPDLGSARRAYGAFTRSTDSGHALRLLQRELQRADIALDFNVRGVTVAHLSGQSQGGLVSRALRLNGTDIRLRGVLRALLRWRR